MFGDSEALAIATSGPAAHVCARGSATAVVTSSTMSKGSRYIRLMHDARAASSCALCSTGGFQVFGLINKVDQRPQAAPVPFVEIKAQARQRAQLGLVVLLLTHPLLYKAA